MTRPEARPAPPHDPDREDDRWLGDLPNDLGALSLSSDEIPASRPEDMGCVHYEDASPTPKRHHDTFGP